LAHHYQKGGWSASEAVGVGLGHIWADRDAVVADADHPKEIQKARMPPPALLRGGNDKASITGRESI
jgi:hypothetical protein